MAQVLAQGDDIVPIPAPSIVNTWKKTPSATDIELTDEELDQIDEIAPKGGAAGERYSEEFVQTVKLVEAGLKNKMPSTLEVLGIYHFTEC